MPLISVVGSFAYIKANFVSISANVASFWDRPYEGGLYYYTQAYNSTTQKHKVVYSQNGTNQLAIFTIDSPTNINSSTESVGKTTIGSAVWSLTPLSTKYETLSGNNTVAMTGYLNYQNTYAYASFITSFDSNNLVSANTYNLVAIGNVSSNIGQRAVNYRQILLNDDGSRIALGTHDAGVGVGPSNSYAGMTKIDSTTNQVWQKNYTFADAGPNLGRSGFRSSKLDTTTGDFYSTGYVIPNANTSNHRTFLTKFDSTGNIVWQQRTPNATVSYDDTDVTCDSSYAYFLAPRTNGNVEIFKLHSANGAVAGNVRLSVTTSLGGFPTIDFVDGNLLVSYVDTVGAVGSRKNYLVNMSTGLSVNWARTISMGGGMCNYITFDTVSTVPSIILGGYTSTSGSGVTTIRIPSDGSIPGNGTYTMTNYLSGTPTLVYANATVTTTTTTFALSSANGTMATATNPVNTYTVTLTDSTGQMGYVNLGT